MLRFEDFFALVAGETTELCGMISKNNQLAHQKHHGAKDFRTYLLIRSEFERDSS